MYKNTYLLQENASCPQQLMMEDGTGSHGSPGSQQLNPLAWTPPAPLGPWAHQLRAHMPWLILGTQSQGASLPQLYSSPELMISFPRTSSLFPVTKEFSLNECLNRNKQHYA